MKYSGRAAMGAVATLVAVLSAGAASPAGAQQADSSPTTAQIVVTGTHVKDRTELNASVPVDILSAEDLRAVAGPEANLGQALQSLLPSFNYLDQSNSGSADHVRAGQLRGLSPDQTLVLINGKRVHPTSIVNVESVIGLGSVAVDFASIPVNAVKRIEVLRDGAGAQYGSDAVAGVINVILDDARGGGALEINTGLFHTHFAPTDRTITDGQSLNAQGKYGLALGETGFVRFGVDATHHNPTHRAGFDQLYPNAFNLPANPNSTAVTFQVGDARIDNLNLWANSSMALSGSTSLYGVVLFNHRNSSGDAYFREPQDSFNNGVYPNGFLPKSTGTNEDLHLSTGARGHLAGPWDYDASLTYGENTFAYGLSDSLNASYGSASPTGFNLGSFRFAQTTANFDATGDVDWLGLASASTFAYGAEFRRESFKTEAGDPASYLLGTQVPGAAPGAQGDGGLDPGSVSSNDRNIAGIYGDLSGKIIPSVFADLGVRFDHYNDVGSTTTGKLSARWEVAPAWGLRGAVSNNFRAPALAQIWSAYSPTAYTNGTGTLGTVHIVPVSSPIAILLGGQPLKPERSTNLSAGITGNPVAALRLSLDFFRVDIRDRIALSQQILDVSNNNFYQFFTNAVDTRTQGAELVAAWTTALLGGELHLSDASMRSFNSIESVRPQPLDSFGHGLLFGLQAQNAITTAIPKQRDVICADWRGGGWNLLTRLSRTGEVTRVFDFSSFGGGTPTQVYGSTVQLDLEGEYHFTRALALALGAQNLTDRYPTQSNASINYFGNLPYDFLPPIGFNGRYLYARVHYDLR